MKQVWNNVRIESTANVCFGQAKTDIELISKSFKLLLLFYCRSTQSQVLAYNKQPRKL